MQMRFTAFAAVAAACLAVPVLAQNPRGEAATTVAGKKIAVDYGRPALKGRALDDLLKQLPADRMWRAGENQVSTFTTETALDLAGTKVPAGKYSLYVHAGEKGDWSLVLNHDLGVPLGQVWAQAPDNMKNEPWPYMQGYTEKIGEKEVARVKLQAAKVATPADLFTISFAPADKGAKMTLAWGSQAWSIDVAPAK